MSIDISKIKVGDKVTVETEVRFVSENRNYLTLKIPSGGVFGIHSIDVVNHTPHPREIKVGDTVTPSGCSQAWKVLARHGGYAWVQFENHKPSSLPVEGLRHYDPDPR